MKAWYTVNIRDGKPNRVRYGSWSGHFGLAVKYFNFQTRSYQSIHRLGVF